MTKVVLLNPVPALGGAHDPVDVFLAADPPDGTPPDLLARLEAGQAVVAHVTPGSRIVVACPDELDALPTSDGETVPPQQARA